MTVKYIEKDALKDLLKDAVDDRTSLLIVDVRDDDHKGGNISGSLHVPSSIFHDAVDDLVKDKARNVGSVVFHCSYSQQRGPKSARIYAETREKYAAKEGFPPQQIFILRGGFTEWQAAYKDDPELVEKWDSKVWGGNSYLQFWSTS